MEVVSKPRITWIDTAKGICILLVVLDHTSQLTQIEYPFQNDFTTFRMPLYFILSGLFFKQYEGLTGFIKRKLNKLIIPYTFFFTFLGVLLPVCLYHQFGFRTWFYSFYGFEAFKWIFSEKILCNPSIWFLVCLFEVNILFYFINMLASTLSNNKSRVVVVALLSIFGGIIGVLFYVLHIDIPYFIDSSLSALPFFCFGWVLRNKTNFLYMENNKTNTILTVLFIIGSLAIIHFFNYGQASIHENSYGGRLGIIQFYPYGILGTICVLSLARLLGHIPFVSYLGRYSIIVLCTHAYFIQFSASLIYHLQLSWLLPIMCIFSIFCLTALFCGLTISLFINTSDALI